MLPVEHRITSCEAAICHNLFKILNFCSSPLPLHSQVVVDPLQMSVASTACHSYISFFFFFDMVSTKSMYMLAMKMTFNLSYPSIFCHSDCIADKRWAILDCIHYAVLFNSDSFFLLLGVGHPIFLTLVQRWKT